MPSILQLTLMSLLSTSEARSDSSSNSNGVVASESQPALFRIDPDFQATPLVSSRATASSAFYSATFAPANPSPWFARLRKHHLYYWFVLGYALFLVVTELGFSFQTSYWWFALYLTPFVLFAACELTGADRSTLSSLAYCKCELFLCTCALHCRSRRRNLVGPVHIV